MIGYEIMSVLYILHGDTFYRKKSLIRCLMQLDWHKKPAFSQTNLFLVIKLYVIFCVDRACRTRRATRVAVVKGKKTSKKLFQCQLEIWPARQLTNDPRAKRKE